LHGANDMNKMKTKPEENTISALYEKTTRKVGGTIHHYTSYGSAVSILTKRTFQLTRIDLLNDKMEKTFADCSDNEVMYVLSFTNTSKESVAMWMLYGGVVGAGGIKVKMSIPRSKIIDSFNNQFFFDPQMKKQIPFEKLEYGVENYKKKKFSLRDVVYLDRRNGKLRYSTKSYEGDCTESELLQMFKGFIKYDAWEFESEARVAVILLNQDKIADAPKHIYAKIDEELLKTITITTDPWTSEDMKNVMKESLNSLAGVQLRYQSSNLEGDVDF